MIKVVRYFIVFLLMPQLVLACQQCFGANVNTATTRGIGFAMLGLLVFTGFVSTGIVMFFLNMNRRGKIFSRDLVNEPKLLPEKSSPEILNHLLDKINESGFQSLSHQEKEVLQEISKSEN